MVKRVNTTANGSADAAAMRDEWLSHLRELAKQAQVWAEEHGWSTRLFPKKMEDSRLGRYEAPALMMQKDATRVLLDPVARFAPGTEGVVDLYLMPAYDDIASLYFVNGSWQLHRLMSPRRASAGNMESCPLSKEVLAEVLEEMFAHAAEPF